VLSKSVISAFAAAMCLVPPVLGCQTGGGDFVGTEVDPRRGTQCGLCITDPPPAQVDCAKEEADTEFLPVTIWDFETRQTDMRPKLASNMYTYSDDSGLFAATQTSWEPLSTPEQRCLGGAADNHVFHYKAGPFLNWGGAVGRHFKCLNGSTHYGEPKVGSPDWGGTIGCGTADMDDIKACVAPPAENPTREQRLAWSVCPRRDKEVIQAGSNSDPGMAGSEEYLLAMSLDLSKWDGISFWARRSSDSQPGIRVSIGDRFTDDDISYMQYHVNPDDQRACERNVECGCNGNSECSLQKPSEYLGTEAPAMEDAEWRCWDLPPAFHNSDGTASTELLPPECGQQMCTNSDGTPRIYDSLQQPDIQRAGTTCQAYTFRGGIEGSFCYSEDNPPKENSELCGDHWTYPVYLSTEWKFYKVPFTSLLQQGWAKKFDKLDMSTATMIRFQWGTGWVDFWLDDVRVYRDKRNSEEG
jgi:hypothetical protein